MLRRWSRFLGVVLTWLLATASLPAQFRTPEYENFHNSTFVGQESEEVRAALFAVDEHLAAGRELEAGRELRRLLSRRDPGLIRYGERLVLPVERVVALRLMQLPADIRTALVDDDAATGLLADPMAPLSVLTGRAAMFPLERVGEAALFRLGQRMLLEGQYGAAASYLEELVHWPNSYPGDFKVLGAARLREATARAGSRSASGLLTRWPTGTVEQDGQPVDLSTLIFPPAVPGGADWPTLGGNDRRDRLPRHTATRLEPSLCLAAVSGRRINPDQMPHRRRFQADPVNVHVMPAGLPLVHQGSLYSLERDGLHVRDLTTGRDRFPPVRYDFDLHVDPGRFRLELDPQDFEMQEPSQGSSLAIAGNMLYVTLQLYDRDSFPYRPHGALFGLDLTRECYVVFGRRSWDPPETDPDHGWSYAGPPVVAAGRLLVPAMRRVVNDTECQLLSFDPRTGVPNGRRFVGRAGAVAPFADRFSQDDGRSMVVASPAAVQGGVVYVCTNLGVVAAVRAADLGVQWLFRYNRRLPADSRRYRRETLFTVGGWPARAPVAFEDRVLVSPSDSRYLYSLARWPTPRGDLVLNDPVEKEARLAWIGATREELFFLAGHGTEQSVEATDHWGAPRWKTPLPVSETVVGVPAQTADALYLPTDRRIYRLRLDRRDHFDLMLAPPEAVGVPYPEFGVFGDLIATEDHLLSVSSLFLNVYRLAD